MKILFTVTIYLAAFSISNAQGYKVTLQASDYNSGIAYLTYYYGKNINIEDSGVVNNKGVVIFQKNEKLVPGVYSVVFPGKNKLFDFLVDKEQLITIKADTSDLINKTTVTGSKENILFQQYQKFVSSKGSYLQRELTDFRASKNKGDSL